jgi:cholest-4-en-3-one 26-monooxygenase
MTMTAFGDDSEIPDVLDPALYLGDPHPAFTWLRQNAPFFWDERHDLWIASKYEDVVYISKHPELFCSGKGVRPKIQQLISIVTMDEPRHGRLRKLVNKGFTPRMVGMLERKVSDVVRRSIDAIAPHGRCDFVRDLAVDLPIMMIAEMLGIRPEDRARFHEWSDTMIAAGVDNPPPEVMNGAMLSFQEFSAYLNDIFDDRRRAPKDDLASILVAAKDDGVLTDDDGMSNDELLMFMTLLLVAGNETTRNALSGGIIALAQNPGERRKLHTRPELIDSAVEEIVRWVSPVMNFARTVTQDTTIREHQLREGQQVMMLYPSANRDEDVFEDALTFKVDRDPNDHIGFGIGNHFCLGANLARLEIRTMIGELIRRLPDIDMAPEARPVFAPSSFVRGITQLPMVFTPEARV